MNVCRRVGAVVTCSTDWGAFSGSRCTVVWQATRIPTMLTAINLDHVQTVEQRLLHRYVGSLTEPKMRQVCRALAIATGCA